MSIRNPSSPMHYFELSIGPFVPYIEQAASTETQPFDSNEVKDPCSERIQRLFTSLKDLKAYMKANPDDSSGNDSLDETEVATVKNDLKDRVSHSPRSDVEESIDPEELFKIAASLKDSDPNKAHRYFLMAADDGYAPAYQWLASAYNKGIGTEPNQERAAFYYNKCLPTVVDDYYFISECSSNPNVREKYLKKAATLGHLRAYYELGLIAEKKELHEKATGYFLKAAFGIKEACLKLAEKGISPNFYLYRANQFTKSIPKFS